MHLYTSVTCACAILIPPVASLETQSIQYLVPDPLVSPAVDAQTCEPLEVHGFTSAGGTAISFPAHWLVHF